MLKTQDYLQHNVTRLIHFTKITNLESILTNGLCSRSTLDKSGQLYYANDSKRLDGCLEGTSLSVSHANGFLLAYFRKTTDIPYVMISLNPELLCNIPCVFCGANAANANVRAYSLDSRKLPEAWHDMFAYQSNGSRYTRQYKFRPEYPTDEQAEVLALETISTNYFQEIICENEDVAAKCRDIVKGKFNVKVEPNLYLRYRVA